MDIQEEMYRTLLANFAYAEEDPSVAELAAALMPLVKRAQAEALREARADIQAYTESGAPFGHRPVEEFLLHRADRIEQGETDD